MKFHLTSFRNGARILTSTPAFRDVADALTGIGLDEVTRLRDKRQARQPGRKAGIQDGLNSLIRTALEAGGWRPFVPVFEPDPDTKKGLWVMDFAKDYAPAAPIRVGLEVTFNHAEALTWTPIRLTLAHEAEDVLPDARIDVGVIVIGTDNLKGHRQEGLRMDSAVGTYERLITVLPKMRAVLPAPLVVFGLDWADGGQVGDIKELSLHTSAPSVRYTVSGPDVSK